MCNQQSKIKPRIAQKRKNMSNLTRNSLSPFTGLRNIAKGLRLISLAGGASMAFSPLYADIEGGGDKNRWRQT